MEWKERQNSKKTNTNGTTEIGRAQRQTKKNNCRNQNSHQSVKKIRNVFVL